MPKIIYTILLIALTGCSVSKVKKTYSPSSSCKIGERGRPLGCSSRMNLKRMIASPKTLKTPHKATPSFAEKESKAIDKMIEGKTENLKIEKVNA